MKYVKQISKDGKVYPLLAKASKIFIEDKSLEEYLNSLDFTSAVPVFHADEENTYGISSTENYGHIKINEGLLTIDNGILDIPEVNETTDGVLSAAAYKKIIDSIDIIEEWLSDDD